VLQAGTGLWRRAGEMYLGVHWDAAEVWWSGSSTESVTAAATEGHLAVTSPLVTKGE